MRVAQVLGPSHLLSRSLGVQSMFQTSQSGSVRQEGELRLELWCTETTFSEWGKRGFGVVIIVLRSGDTLLDFWHCGARDGGAVVSLEYSLPRFVCCMDCSLQIQPTGGSLCIIENVEKGSSGRFDKGAQPRKGCSGKSPANHFAEFAAWLQ